MPYGVSFVKATSFSHGMGRHHVKKDQPKASKNRSNTKSRQKPDTLRAPAESQLSGSREWFRILAEATFEGIILTEAGHILEVNDQLARMRWPRALRQQRDVPLGRDD
jgi:PAS domain-containing protein